MILPKQKTSTKEKFSKDEVTGLNQLEQTAEYYINQIPYNDQHEEILSLYKLTEDEIDSKDYNYVLNPFNTKIEKYTKFRGRLRNYNIISPVLEMFLSEFGRRKHTPKVLQSNPLEETKKQKALNEMLKGYFAQKSINALNEAGVNTGKPSVEQPSVEEAKAEFDRTYSDNRVITGQEALDYIIYDHDLQDKYIELYESYLICGRAIDYKGISHNDINFEVIPAVEAFFPHSVNKPFLEDRDWFIRKFGLTPNQALDRFNGKLSDKLIEHLDDFNRQGADIGGLNNASGHIYMSDDDFKEKYSSMYYSEDNALNCYHVVFKSFKKVGELTYTNPVGEIKTMDVDDTYVLDKEAGDISIKWDYINAVYETTKICYNGGEEFIDTKEIEYDRSEVNNKSVVKLPYNGRVLCTQSGEIKSIVKTGKNYQVLYNVLKYGFEKMMNKNKDKLLIMPLGLINKGKQGWDEEKSMYFAEANSMMFIDETAPNAALSLQGIKALDMSLGKYAGEIIGFTNQIKEEWWDSVGMNRQRYGESKTSDGKANTEQAIFRSSLITENLVRKFEKLQEKDYAGLLDLSKIAWIDGVKGQYINSEGKDAFIELNADDALYHLESDYDTHVKFSGEENEKMQKMEQYLFNFTQNGGSLATTLDAMDITSFTKGKELIRKEEQLRQQVEQGNVEAERASQEKIAQMNMQATEAEREAKKYDVDMRYKGLIESTQMKIEADAVGEEDVLLETMKEDWKMRVEDAKLQQEAYNNQRENDRKDKEAESKITKEKAETAKLKKETKIMTAKPVTSK